MKDKQGVELRVGQTVVHAFASGSISLVIGTITGFTPKMVRIDVPANDGGSVYKWNAMPHTLIVIREVTIMRKSYDAEDLCDLERDMSELSYGGPVTVTVEVG